MPSDQDPVTSAYLAHLTDSDVSLLAGGLESAGRAARGTADERRAWLRSRRGGIEDLLSAPEIHEAVFLRTAGDHLLADVSPFLAFAVAVQQATLQLGSATYVAEWVGVGRRTPLFDVARLRDFAASPWNRYFLTELLASYTHVASGSFIVPTRRGLRRQRFSELDPVRLAGLLEVVSEAERPGVLRRLGDLALFLTGVFPDYVARRGFAPIEQSRLARAARKPSSRAAAGPGGAASHAIPGDGDAVALLEQLGRRCYRAAFELLRGLPVPDNVAVLGELPERFGDARRILGLVTERHLFPHRDRWFGAAQG
jgi:hypothetical protein